MFKNMQNLIQKSAGDTNAMPSHEVVSLEVVSAKINITELIVMLPTKTWVLVTTLRDVDDLVYKKESTKHQDRFQSDDLKEFTNAWYLFQEIFKCSKDSKLLLEVYLLLIVTTPNNFCYP